MTKTQLIDELSQALGQSKQETDRVLEAVLTTFKNALAKGEKLDLRGFGVFKVRESKARQARNPRTGETVAVPARKTPTFKPSKDFSGQLNTSSAGGE